MNWPAVRQGLSDAGVKAAAFKTEHPFAAGVVVGGLVAFIVGFVLG